MSIESPTYKEEDLTINNEDEMKEAKEAAGVKSHEEAMNNAAQHAVETDDGKLLDNADEQGANLNEVETRLREAGVSEDELEIINDGVKHLAQGDKPKEIALKNRASRFYEKLKDAEKVIEQLKDEEARPAKSKKTFVN